MTFEEPRPAQRTVLWQDAFVDAWERREAWRETLARRIAEAITPPAAPTEQDPPG
jgi:hypothetical protein